MLLGTGLKFFQSDWSLNVYSVAKCPFASVAAFVDISFAFPFHTWAPGLCLQLADMGYLINELIHMKLQNGHGHYKTKTYVDLGPRNLKSMYNFCHRIHFHEKFEDTLT